MNTENEIHENENLQPHHHHHHKDAANVKSSLAKKIIIAALTIILICAASFGIFALIRNVDYMRPVRDICSIYNNRETDTHKLLKIIYSSSDRKAYNQAYKIIANSDTYYNYFENLPAQLEEYYRDNAASGGSDIKMKFDTTGTKDKMDDSQLAIIYNEIEAQATSYKQIIDTIDNMGKEDIQTFADSMGISYRRASSLCDIIRSRCESFIKFSLSSGYYITGRYVLCNKTGDTVDKTDKLTLAVVKFNGKWCIYDGKEDGVRLATGMDSLADNDILWDIYNNYIKTVR